MALAIISIILFLILVIVAVRIGLNQGDVEEETTVNPIIHASGIYSIVRKNPGEELQKVRPTSEDIRKYLASLNEDIGKLPLSQTDKEKLFNFWEKSMAENTEVIEQGDKEGVEFYYYEFSPDDCPVCNKYINKGQFVTREEIFLHPSIIPPFHLGCTSVLCPHHGKENLRDTTELGMYPLFKEENIPPLPDWKTVIKLDFLRGTMT